MQGVPGYTEHGQHRDLYIYFDHADKTSPINELASKAFRMYGLRGAARLDWALIRGPAVVLRAEPPCKSYEEMLACSNVQLQRLTVNDVASTLLYFRDRCARTIAVERDMARAKEHRGLVEGLRHQLTRSTVSSVVRVQILHAAAENREIREADDPEPASMLDNFMRRFPCGVDGFGDCSALDVGALQRRLRDAPLFARYDGHNRTEPAPQQLSSAITSRCCAI